MFLRSVSSKKVFFICEPFITVTNNTNSYGTRDC